MVAKKKKVELKSISGGWETCSNHLGPVIDGFV